MAEKKITKRERFEQIKALIADNKELVEFIDHEIELLARKASKSATATPCTEGRSYNSRDYQGYSRRS